MALKDLIPELKQYFLDNEQLLDYNSRILRVWEGQLQEEVENSLRVELSEKAFKRARTRIPPINVLTRIIDKLSRVYAQPATRLSDKKANQEIMNDLSSSLCIDETMATANAMYNLHKNYALEPFIEDGEMQLRVLPADRFLVWSNDTVNPLKPKVFMKLLGKELDTDIEEKQKGTSIARTDGIRIRKDTTIEQVFIIAAYSDDEILIFDSKGKIRHDKMTAFQINGRNPLGRIPFIYDSKSEFRLVPVPDTDTLQNTVLIPKLLADLNYAVQYLSHSVFVAKNAKLPNTMEMNPDTIVEIEDIADDKTASFEVVKPEVDITQVLSLIQAILIMWLESKNIKAGSIGKSSEQRASGVAKIIDEADASQERVIQARHFAKTEKKVWRLLSDFQRVMLPGSRQFTQDFTMSAQYGDQKPSESMMERLLRIEKAKEIGVMTLEMMLKELHPEASQAIIDKLKDELEKESISFGIQLGESDKELSSQSDKQSDDEQSSDSDS